MYEELGENRITYPLYTGTTVGATGATTLVSAPGESQAILIDGLYIYNNSDQTGQHDIAFHEGSAGALAMFRTLQSQTDTSVSLNLDLQTPWRLETNTALLANLSMTTASTPAAVINVRFRRITL